MARRKRRRRKGFFCLACQRWASNNMCCDQCGSENPWNELEWLAEELLDKDDET
jgi:hypothetical protein